MKIHSLISLTALTLASVLFAADRSKPAHPPALTGSPELERIKALAGTWKGQADMGQGPMEITADYRVIGAGSAVEERLFPGTPMEMVTVYHDRGGKLSLTHYCSLGNQPVMRLKSTDPKAIKLELDSSAGVGSADAKHMHALELSFDSPDTITQHWTLFDGGKAEAHTPFTLKRAKS